MFKKFQNVLILAPHTDDGELACGATIAKLTEAGASVSYIAFSIARESVPKHFPEDILKTELMKATNRLGIQKENVTILDYQVRRLSYFRQEILEDIIVVRKRIQPDLVLIPSLNDIHQDHSTVAQEGLRAFKNTTLLGYELIWNNPTFNAQAFMRLDEIHVQKKIEALRQYESQAHRNYMGEEFVRAQLHTRGVQIGVKYAECFEVIRWFLN